MESCDAGVCHDAPIPGCKLCATPSDCDDGNLCTYDTCDGGVCGNTPIDGCKTCTTSVDCNDGNVCSYDSCDGGVCSNTMVEGCKRCAVAGNCNDDDGNGLTDFEDPACAGQTGTLTLENGRLRPSGNATRMDLHALLAGVTMNADADDVTLQIRPENGTDVFCARIPAASLV